MNLQEFRDNPAILGNFNDVKRPIDDFLVSHLIATNLGQNPDATTAEAQVGAAKAIANIIMIFRGSGSAQELKKPVTLKKLNRFGNTQPNTDPANP